MNIPKINFYVASPEKAAEFIFSLKESLGEDENDAEEKYENEFDAILISLKRELVKKIIPSKELTAEIKEELINAAKAHLEKAKRDLVEELRKIKAMWNGKVQHKFWNEMIRIIGKEAIIKKEYNAYLSNIVCGAYYGENEVSIPRYKEGNTALFTFVLSEELSHIIYWKILEKVLKIKKDENIWNPGKNGWSLWNISETIPEYLFVENKNFSDFGWNKIKRTNSYPWIPEIRRILDPLWNKRKSFEDFIISAHKELGF